MVTCKIWREREDKLGLLYIFLISFFIIISYVLLNILFNFVITIVVFSLMLMCNCKLFIAHALHGVIITTRIKSTHNLHFNNAFFWFLYPKRGKDQWWKYNCSGSIFIFQMQHTYLIMYCKRQGSVVLLPTGWSYIFDWFGGCWCGLKDRFCSMAHGWHIWQKG